MQIHVTVEKCFLKYIETFKETLWRKSPFEYFELMLYTVNTVAYIYNSVLDFLKQFNYKE